MVSFDKTEIITVPLSLINFAGYLVATLVPYCPSFIEKSYFNSVELFTIDSVYLVEYFVNVSCRSISY